MSKLKLWLFRALRLFFLGIVSVMILVFTVVLTDSMQYGHANAALRSCTTNLKIIQNAKATWALDRRKKPEDIPAWSDLIGSTNYLPSLPVCPRGGTYTLGSVDQQARCSIPQHVLQ